MIPNPDVEFEGVTLPAARMSREGVAGRRLDDGIIDEVAVERALRWETLALSPREVVAAVALGARRGYLDDEIADRLGMSERQILRLRTKYDIPTRYVPPPPSHRSEAAKRYRANVKRRREEAAAA